MLGGATSSNTTPFTVRINTSGDYFREASLILLVESSFTGAKEMLKVPLLTESAATCFWWMTTTVRSPIQSSPNP
jgi:hypothetical protein